MVKSIAIFAFFLFFLTRSFSAPFKMEAKHSFSGKISSYLWIGKSSFKYEGDNFLLEEYESTPAYYIILETNELTKKASKEVSSMSGHTFHTLSHQFHFQELKKNQVMLYVPSSKLKNIKKGLKVNVQDYTGWGDEYMSKVSWKSLSIGEEEVTSPDK